MCNQRYDYKLSILTKIYTYLTKKLSVPLINFLDSILCFIRLHFEIVIFHILNIFTLWKSEFISSYHFYQRKLINNRQKQLNLNSKFKVCNRQNYNILFHKGLSNKTKVYGLENDILHVYQYIENKMNKHTQNIATTSQQAGLRRFTCRSKISFVNLNREVSASLFDHLYKLSKISTSTFEPTSQH